MDRIITFGSGGEYRAKFDIIDSNADFEIANLSGSESYGLSATGVFEKYGPGTLVLGYDDVSNGGGSGYLCGITAFEIYEGAMANSSDDYVQLNVDRYAEEGPAILLGDGVSLSFSSPLNGTDQNFDFLEISGDGEIDFADGDSILTIGDSSAVDWRGSLLINNWDGDYSAGGGNDQLFIGSGQTLSDEQLTKISSSKTDATAKQLPNGEVVFKPSGTFMILR